MTNNANQKRQPKGTDNGGQFAPDVNAESTLELSEESMNGDSQDPRAAIYDAQENVDLILHRYGGSRDELPAALFGPGDSTELFNDTMTIVTKQREIIEELETKLAESDRARASFSTRTDDAIASRANVPGRLRGLTSCAYAVDEAIDTLTRWDGGSGADPADVLAHLIEVRDEIFSAANPELVKQWGDIESNIRGFENDPDSSPLDDEEYEVARDERETVFRKIYEEAFAS